MKKTRSIFFKIALWMVPTVLLLDMLVLLLSYNTTYRNTLAVHEKQITNAAQMTVQYCESFNLYDDLEEESRGGNKEFNDICKSFDITYAFIVDLDLDKNTETYLAIGFGDDASQAAKETRYSGVTVQGMINDEEIKAYNGDIDGEILHEMNTFGESLTCYWPCTRYYDNAKMEYVNYDHPLIVGTEITLDTVVNSVRQQFGKLAVLTVFVTLLIVAAFGVILYFKVSIPVRRISRRMSKYVADRENEKHREKLIAKGNDEFALMVRSFNTMTDEIDRYLDDIDTLTRDMHTQEAELNIARNIQKGLLRPEHFDSDGITIDAYMLPARDVGGDLYDYQILDDGRVFITVADVSGKGISAALFMARAITLLHQFTLTNSSPANILSIYNDTLAEQNPGGLFITTFLAVWDPVKGELTYSNAGHNFPYIISKNLVTLDEAHGVAAGLFPGEEYEDATVPFGADDILFLYTDGVNEAKNAEDAFYSTERLEKKLTEYAETDRSDILNSVLNDLNEFTHGAAQNDDITMLTLHIRQNPDEIVLKLQSELAQLTTIKEAIFSLKVSDDLKKTLCLAAEEMFVNICSYAYDEPGEAELKITPTDAGVALTFTDHGKPFDPTAELLDIDEYDHENAIGGLGCFLTFSDR